MATVLDPRGETFAPRVLPNEYKHKAALASPHTERDPTEPGAKIAYRTRVLHSSDSLFSLPMLTSRTETYLVSDIGTCLMLKLCGFIEQYRADIRDVDENHLHLRLGGSWFQQLLGRNSLGYPLDLELLFVPVESATDTRPLVRVQVVVQNARLISSPDRFEVAAHRVLWQLRNHLMVV